MSLSRKERDALKAVVDLTDIVTYHLSLVVDQRAAMELDCALRDARIAWKELDKPGRARGDGEPTYRLGALKVK
jgi:hypothetical protein